MFKVKITSNFKEAAKSFDEMIEENRKAILDSVDKPIMGSVTEIRAKIKQIIETVNLRAGKESSITIPKEIEQMSMTKATVIKMVTGEDLRLSQVFQSSKDGMFYQKNDGSNVFPVMKGHVGMSQSITDGTSYEQYINTITERFSNGVYVDPKTGRSFILPEDAEAELRDAIKIECSTEHIDHPNSKKAFYRWKTSLNKNARKSPQQKYINARMFQDRLKKLLDKAVPLDEVIDTVLDGDLQQTKSILQQRGPSKYQPLIENVEAMKEEVNLKPDEQAVMNLVNLNKNLQVTKKKVKDKVQYGLTTSYTAEGQAIDNVVMEIEQQLALALPDIGEAAFKALVQAIEQVIREYGSK